MSERNLPSSNPNHKGLLHDIDGEQAAAVKGQITGYQEQTISTMNKEVEAKLATLPPEEAARARQELMNQLQKLNANGGRDVNDQPSEPVAQLSNPTEGLTGLQRKIAEQRERERLQQLETSQKASTPPATNNEIKAGKGSLAARMALRRAANGDQ